MPTGEQNLADVPDWNPDFKGQVISGTVDRWFDPNAFKMPIGGTSEKVATASATLSAPPARADHLVAHEHAATSVGA